MLQGTCKIVKCGSTTVVKCERSAAHCMCRDEMVATTAESMSNPYRFLYGLRVDEQPYEGVLQGSGMMGWLPTRPKKDARRAPCIGSKPAKI